MVKPRPKIMGSSGSVTLCQVDDFSWRLALRVRVRVGVGVRVGVRVDDFCCRLALRA